MTPGRGGERLRLLAVLALTAALAVWMDLSPLHRFHDSDSLVPVLMSLQRWTPFYWEQNRYGMLVPLLAVPVRGPYHNLLLQVALRLFAVVLSFFLVARAAVPRPYWPAVGAATLGLYVAGRGLFAHCFLEMQPYPQALALGLTGVMILEGRPLAGLGAWRAAGRVGAAALLVGLAFWVSLSLIVWLLAFLLLRRVLGLEPKARLLPFVLVVLAFGAGMLAARTAQWSSTDWGLAAASTWPHAWATLVRHAVTFLGAPLVIAAIVVLAGAGLATLGARSPRARLAVSAGLCLAGAAAAELLVLGTSSWVRLNDLSIRFLWCALLAAGTALPAVAFILLLEGRERWHRGANIAACLILLPVVFLRFGPPSPAAARAAFARHVGPAAPAILAARCTHVIGSYWRVWPAVLQADEILWERGETRRVWGITTRSRPTRDLWQPRSWAAARVAVLHDDAVAATAMGFYRVPPLFLAADGPGLRVYSGSPPGGAAVILPAPLRGRE